jgi:hypothetical protein
MTHLTIIDHADRQTFISLVETACAQAGRVLECKFQRNLFYRSTDAVAPVVPPRLEESWVAFLLWEEKP